MKRRNAPEVDITPLIDMMFMLIIFFVITTSFARGEISVNLPNGEGNKMEGENAILNISADGIFSFDGKIVESADLAQLARNAGERGKKFVIAGDTTTPYGKVAETLDLLRREGIETATLAIEKR